MTVLQARQAMLGGQPCHCSVHKLNHAAGGLLGWGGAQNHVFEKYLKKLRHLFQRWEKYFMYDLVKGE